MSGGLALLVANLASKRSGAEETGSGTASATGGGAGRAGERSLRDTTSLSSAHALGRRVRAEPHQTTPRMHFRSSYLDCFPRDLFYIHKLYTS